MAGQSREGRTGHTAGNNWKHGGRSFRGKAHGHFPGAPGSEGASRIVHDAPLVVQETTAVGKCEDTPSGLVGNTAQPPREAGPFQVKGIAFERGGTARGAERVERRRARSGMDRQRTPAAAAVQGWGVGRCLDCRRLRIPSPEEAGIRERFGTAGVKGARSMVFRVHALITVIRDHGTIAGTFPCDYSSER